MKTAHPPFSRMCCGAVLCASVLVGGSVKAQQLAISADEFYKQGDRFSEKVSGFFRDLFRTEPPRQTPPAQQPAYQTPQSYQQAPSQLSSRRSTASSTASTYREAPLTKSRTQSSPPPKTKSSPVASSSTTKRSKTVQSEPVRRSTPKTDSAPVYTTSKKKSDPLDEQAPIKTKEAASPKVKETVVSAPKTETTSSPTPSPSVGLKDSISPFAVNNDTASTLPMPKVEAPKETPKEAPPPTVNTTTKQPTVAANAGQEFPTGSIGKKPGRVVSPYPPHNELDVRGLPSGSLALDPTTQKVFKVP